MLNIFARLTNIFVYFSTAHVCGATCPPLGCDTGLPTVNLDSTSVSTILQYVFGIIGAVSIIIIIIAALKFIFSQGDSQGVSRARQTIIYAVIGLVISISAEVIVSYVLTNI